MMPGPDAWIGDEQGGPHGGIDACEIPRIAAALDRWGQRFLDRVYTPAEQRYCRGSAERLAGRFAAKEAVSKALGTGIRALRWKDIEILPNRYRRPTVYLYGKAAARAEAMGATWLSVSITHTDTLALAFVVARTRVHVEGRASAPAASSAFTGTASDDVPAVLGSGLGRRESQSRSDG